MRFVLERFYVAPERVNAVRALNAFDEAPMSTQAVLLEIALMRGEGRLTLSSTYGTYKTVKARFEPGISGLSPWISGKSP